MSTQVDGGAFDPDKAYKDSKLCNVMFTREVRNRYIRWTQKCLRERGWYRTVCKGALCERASGREREKREMESKNE